MAYPIAIKCYCARHTRDHKITQIWAHSLVAVQLGRDNHLQLKSNLVMAGSRDDMGDTGRMGR